MIEPHEQYLGHSQERTEKMKTCLQTKTCYKCGQEAEWIPVFILLGAPGAGILFQAAPFCTTCVCQREFEKNADLFRAALLKASLDKVPGLTMKNFQVSMVKLK
jgi:hypothetical protein